MIHLRSHVCTLFALVLLLAASFGFGQAVNGTILGRVADSTGAVVPGAMIQIQNVGTGYSRAVQTDSAGNYLARDLPLGTYTVTVQQPGFRTEVQSGIVLTVASEMTVNVQLAIGNVTEKVEVTAEAPQVETTNATLSGLINQNQIRDLPLNGRSVDQLALLTPGVFQNTKVTQNVAVGTGIRLSINGQRPDSVLYLLDGMTTNDATNNGHGSSTGQTLGVEGILEFRLLTHSYGAEYGRFAAGVVSAVTRSGTNEFHGSVFEFVRNNAYSARNFFNIATPAFRRNQFGAAAGGRIIKDKIFFFANYEGLRGRQAIPTIATVPDAASRQGLLPTGTVAVNPKIVPYLALYPLPNAGENGDGTGQLNINFNTPTTEDYSMQRMDFRLSDKDNFYFRNVFDPASTINALPTPTFGTTVAGADHLVVMSETHVFSGASLNEFRFGFDRTSQSQISASLTPISPSLSFVPGLAFGTMSFSAASQVAGSLSTLGASMGSGTMPRQNAFEESETFSTVKGAHSLKFGVDFVRQDLNITNSPNSLGNYTFSGLSSLLTATDSSFKVLLTGPTSALASGVSVDERGWRRDVFGAFAQDEWRVRPNLTINMGVREEFITDPAEVNGLTSSHIHRDDLTNTPGPQFTTPKLNLAPRAGIAWDPTGTGKMSIRAGSGIYFNHLEGRNWWGTAAINPQFVISETENNAPFPNALALGLPLTAQQNEGIQYNSETPTVIQWNFEVQRQLARTLSLRIGYVGSHSYHLSRESELNIRIPTILANGTKFFPATGPVYNPNFSNLLYNSTDAVAGYNGVQVVLQKTFSAGLTFQTSYTLGKAMSDADLTVTGQANNSPTGTLDPYNLGRDYSRTAFDQRNLFVTSFAYQMPWEKHLTGKLEKGVLGGWVINGIYTWDTGQPVTPLDGFNRSQDGDSGNTDDRPDLAAGFSNNPTSGVTAGCTGIPGGQALHTPNRWFNPCAFVLETAGTYGNVGRNTIEGPGIWAIDFTLVKTTPITERMKLELRTEVFNLLNHANFGIPTMSQFQSNGTRAGAAGQITTTSTDNRELQFGLKLIF